LCADRASLPALASAGAPETLAVFIFAGFVCESLGASPIVICLVDTLQGDPPSQNPSYASLSSGQEGETYMVRHDLPPNLVTILSELVGLLCCGIAAAACPCKESTGARSAAFCTVFRSASLVIRVRAARCWGIGRSAGNASRKRLQRDNEQERSQHGSLVSDGDPVPTSWPLPSEAPSGKS
jgi:hypothetical protein